MNRYAIYCTKEQTKKAFDLGAPIILESEYYTPTENDIKLDNPIPCESYTCGYHYAKCPTAEQMIGFILESGKGHSIDLSKLIREQGYKQGCLTFIDNCLR